ncbi:sigma factor G inhibitor Gin [Bacillus alkalicellulosilyticus]|uniref:sigma factor G inhibitor Gin n=1 Tax=Alkalihalobacterium alkalicellulosilyticum TaxID=1912214 RepID=UPI0009963DC5|nr:sigma factor G inhibitor Gin [Bacillus alkalicellulosilyticus]
MKPITNTSIPVKKECVVCNQSKIDGIHLFDHFICVTCEREMVKTDPTDEYYHYYLEKLRKIRIPKSS